MSKSSSDQPALFPHQGLVRDADRAKVLGQHGVVVWLTGLSGSGKSTLGQALEKALIEKDQAAFLLDGDNIRSRLNRDLSFSPEDREENIRRLAEVAALFAEAGMITLTAFISPYRAGREKAKERIGAGRFLEIFVDAPTDVCHRRDPKGLYARAEEGSLKEFTGVSAPYEAPLDPDLHLKTDEQSVDDCITLLLQLLQDRGVFLGG